MSLIKRISQSQLITGSILVFIANNIANFGNFLYTLSMGRLLEIERYGDLGAILSLLVLLSIPLSVFNLFIVKIISSYYGVGKRGMVRNIFRVLTPKLFFIGIMLASVLAIVSSPISGFLRLGNIYPVLLLSLFFILSFPTVLNKGVLQGTLAFKFLAINSFIEIGLKLGVSVILVLFNLSLVGALAGPLVGGVVGYLLTIVELNILLRDDKDESVISLRELFSFRNTLPTFFTSITLTIFFTADVILVKHFFDAVIASEYVALSTVGKIIFYAVGPIVSVMFPVISGRSNRGDSYILPLVGTICISLLVSFIMIFMYSFFPQQIVALFYGARFEKIATYLGIFSYFMILYTLNSILTYFLLSVSYYKPIYILFFISLLQGAFIILLHRSISDVIWINIIISLLYFITAGFFVLEKERRIMTKIFLIHVIKSVYGKS